MYNQLQLMGLLIMINETEAYTLKELAEICTCSKIPVKKQLDRLQLPTTHKLQLGKQVTAYILTPKQLESIKHTINIHKKGCNIVNVITDNTTNGVTNNTENTVPVSNKTDNTYIELLNKYHEIKELYGIELNTRKLLEDRQAGQLQELRDKQAEKETLLQEKATISAELVHNKEELTSTRKQLVTYQKCFIVASITALILLLLILTSLVIR